MKDILILRLLLLTIGKDRTRKVNTSVQIVSFEVRDIIFHDRRAGRAIRRKIEKPHRGFPKLRKRWTAALVVSNRSHRVKETSWKSAVSQQLVARSPRLVVADCVKVNSTAGSSKIDSRSCLKKKTRWNTENESKRRKKQAKRERERERERRKYI